MSQINKNNVIIKKTKTMVPINNIYYEDEWITNLQIYLSKYLFVLISFDSLLATETFIHFDWSFEQKKAKTIKTQKY